MHMADALISPAVGGTMWAASAGLLAWCGRKVRQTVDDRMIPLMGVLGAFIFAAQMINFTIPVTGSSGHLGGGLILAILLGPYAAFLVIASVLTVQALFFADGGLLALGCNIFNLGFFPAFIAYPLIYKPIAGEARTGWRFWTGTMLAAILGLQIGSFGVVLETTLSGISDLPFRTFLFLMQPVHLAIGIVEGLVTATVVAFVYKARPVAISDPVTTGMDAVGLRRIVILLLAAAVIIGGGLSWFASTHPDGLEWAIGKVRGKEEQESTVSGMHERMAEVQSRTALLPDYGFKNTEQSPAEGQTGGKWPAVDPGTSIAGLVGGFITMALAGLIGYLLKSRCTVSATPKQR